MSSGADAPNRREVAHRMFAAEFDDASFSYSESDEERAPNYVVTPTGARVNRLFAVGVLTETERVNEEVLRARIADPTGAFVTYAGQYQPDAEAFLERTDPPAFVALTGKARTFEPEDSDRVFTSARPESVNAVDAETRDRWVVTTAEATLQRVAVFREALELGLRGDDLRAALLERGVDESLAAGVPLAIEHYGTTPAYLEAVRRLAVEALELVAGDRDAVGSLDVAPGEGGDVEIGPLPARVGTETGTSGATDAGATRAARSTGAATESGASTETASEGAAAANADESAAGTEAADEDEAEAEATADSESETEAPDRRPAAAAAATDVETVDAGPTGADEANATESATATEAPADATPVETDKASESASAPDPERAEPSDELGDFDDDSSADASSPDQSEATGGDLGDFETDSTREGAAASTETESAGAAGETDATDAGTPEDADDEMYELDDEERREIESEFGTDFETGAEVDGPGQAGIDVPSADELTDETAAEVSTEQPEGVANADADEAAGAEPDPTPDAAESASSTADESVGADEAEAADLDLESEVVETMADLDDGDGAEREAVVAAVADEYGVDPQTVDDAIESALMSGQCYEPAEDRLKAI